MATDTVTLSDASAAVTEAAFEMDRLFAESARVTLMQQGLVESFMKEMRVLSDEQVVIATKIAAMQAVLASLVKLP